MSREQQARERAEWWSKLTVGDKFALGWRGHGSTAQPYLVMTISRMTGSSVFAIVVPGAKAEWRFRRSDARLIGADGTLRQFAEQFDGNVRRVLQDHELRSWIGFSAEQQILKLTKAQQLALKSLVTRMVADTAVLS
jgi:hypothetical protein